MQCANCANDAVFIVDNPSANVLLFCACCVPANYREWGLASVLTEAVEETLEQVQDVDDPATPQDESVRKVTRKK